MKIIFPSSEANSWLIFKIKACKCIRILSSFIWCSHIMLIQIIMHPPSGVEAYMFLSCPSIRLSVLLSVCPSVTFFSPAITNEPLEGLSWNCSIILSTSKWKAELFFQGRPIQDGRLMTIYGRNLFWAITRYWIEILTSNFVCWNLKIKYYDFLSRSSNSRWPTDCHIWSKPTLSHNSVLEWDIDFKVCLLAPQNKILWLFVKVVRFKMADWLPYMIETYFGP